MGEFSHRHNGERQAEADSLTSPPDRKAHDMSVVAISGKANLSTLTGVATPERMGEARKDKVAQASYVKDLVSAYQAIDTMALQVDGAKALHGAYIYRNLEELSVKGKVTIDGSQGPETVPLGTAVAKALGKVSHAEGVKPLSSGSATRYKYISRIYFDAGITPEDPDYADIVNYYVSDSRMAEVLKYKSDAVPADLQDKVRAVVAAIRAPKPVALPTDSNVVSSTATVSDETPAEGDTPAEGESQGPENPAETPAEDVKRENGPRVPAHEMSEVLPRGFSARLDFVETIIYGVKREDVKPEDVKRLTVIAEEIARLIS
jgi:hypothetical protein